MRWMSFVPAAAVCAVLAACGRDGGRAAASGSDAVPDVPAASAVPDVADKSARAADADLAELEAYRLTMTDVNRWAAANRNLAQLAEKLRREHPEQMKDVEDGGESQGAGTFDEYEATVDQIPGAREAIESSGLSVHEFAVIGWPLFQAGMAQYAVEQGADPKELAARAHINPDNLIFARQHKAEIERLQLGR